MPSIVAILGAGVTLITVIAAIVQIWQYWESKRKGDASQVKQNFHLRANLKPSGHSSAVPVAVQKNLSEYSFTDINNLASNDMQQLMQSAGLQALAIDDCVMLAASKDMEGWSAVEVHVTLQETEVDLPPELRQVIEANEDSIEMPYGDTRSYRVVALSPWFTDRPAAYVTLAPVDFQTHLLVSSILDKPILKTPAGKFTTIRQKYGPNALNYAASAHPMIPTPVSLQAVIVAEDDKVLLAQRSEHVLYYPGAWSASLEETMRGPCKIIDKDCTTDHDFVEGVLRGITEELGTKVKVSPDDIRILSFCVEYPTLSFDVLCIAKVHATSKEIMESWLLTAPDKYEANRLEAVPVQFDSLLRLFFDDRLWHPTSRMRLFQFMIYKYGFDKTMAAIQR